MAKEKKIVAPPSSVSWTLKSDTLEHFAFVDSAFSKEECEEIIKIGKSRQLTEAKVSGEAKTNKNIRVSNITFLHPTDMEWAYRKLTDIVNEMNDRFFKFNLWGFGEGIQFTEYNAPDGKYEAHIDRIYNGNFRKLSIVVQLTDPSAYKGGDLELIFGPQAEKMQKGLGRVVAFPSFTLHRVTPVTKGIRHTLVAWVNGPQFK